MALNSDVEEIFVLAQKLGSDDKLELAARLIADARKHAGLKSIANRNVDPPEERPVSDPNFSFANLPMVGIWSDREDMADPVGYVRRLRRHEWGES